MENQKLVKEARRTRILHKRISRFEDGGIPMMDNAQDFKEMLRMSCEDFKKLLNSIE